MLAVGCTGGRHRSVADRRAPGRPLPAGPASTWWRCVHRDVTRRMPAMIDHVGFEVSDLGRSGRFYDAVLLRARRRGGCSSSEHAIAYGVNGAEVWIVVRGRPPAPGYGHLALHASGRAAVDAAHAAGLANGGADDGAAGSAPAVRPAAITPHTCAIPTGCGSRSCPAGKRRRPEGCRRRSRSFGSLSPPADVRCGLFRVAVARPDALNGLRNETERPGMSVRVADQRLRPDRPERVPGRVRAAAPTSSGWR